VAGLGALASGVGLRYLLGAEGLSRRGRGWLLLASGAAAGGVGALLMLQSVAAAERAATVPLRDPRYDAGYDGAAASWRAGAIAAGVGAAAAAGGLWLLLRSPSASAGYAWQLAPQLVGARPGATLLLAF
jgi:hypothetical protein